jgi:hypothetical protein
MLRHFWRWIAIITAPGVYVHEYSHAWFAQARGLDVYDIDYFSLDGDHLGSVVHEQPYTFRGWLAVSFAPFLVNTSVAIAAFVGIGVYLQLTTELILISLPTAGLLIAGWIGASAAFHALPSDTDVSNVTTVKRHLWAASTVPWIQPKLRGLLQSRRWLIVFLFPVVAIVLLMQTVVYVIRAPTSPLSLPVIGVIMIGNRTRKYGSQFVFVAVTAFVASYAIPYGHTAVTRLSNYIELFA